METAAAVQTDTGPGGRPLAAAGRLEAALDPEGPSAPGRAVLARIEIVLRGARGVARRPATTGHAGPRAAG